MNFFDIPHKLESNWFFVPGDSLMVYINLFIKGLKFVKRLIRYGIKDSYSSFKQNEICVAILNFVIGSLKNRKQGVVLNGQVSP